MLCWRCASGWSLLVLFRWVVRWSVVGLHVVFLQAEDGIRDSETWLELRRVLFRSIRSQQRRRNHLVAYLLPNVDIPDIICALIQPRTFSRRYFFRWGVEWLTGLICSQKIKYYRNRTHYVRAMIRIYVIYNKFYGMILHTIYIVLHITNSHIIIKPLTNHLTVS